ncbi:hypothetical protein [Amycolatopsis echigonensis]|uniref:Uncharacterized protein n=1 Tax=Amycolatopsis echigonensis TaxID=2576905 RepID=A0A2N3WEE2_9PSEU|nr:MULTISPECIES: hypothetical protein [Amycolatopsis]MBB2499652.1 hypothetical protein [Amycolatopsis echigonensis]PKV92189.1 hypothetical protein ATK30_2985 [Amycolatopsis niigatensis]
MSVFDVLEQHGPWRLAAFAVSVLLFLALGLLRTPFVAVAWLLRGLQTGLDKRITTCFAGPLTPEPVT